MARHLPFHSPFLLPAPGTTLAQADCMSTLPTRSCALAPRLSAVPHRCPTAPAANPPSSLRPSHLFSSPCLARGAEAPGEAFPSSHLAHLPPRPHLVGFAPLVLGTLFSFLGLPSLCSSPLRNFRDFERHLSLPPKLTSSLDFSSKMWSTFKLQSVQIQLDQKQPRSSSLSPWVSPFPSPWEMML